MMNNKLPKHGVKYIQNACSMSDNIFTAYFSPTTPFTFFLEQALAAYVNT